MRLQGCAADTVSQMHKRRRPAAHLASQTAAMNKLPKEKERTGINLAGSDMAEEASIAELYRTLVSLASSKRNCLTSHEFLDGAGGVAHKPALNEMLWDIWEKEVVCADISVVPWLIESQWTASIQMAHSRCNYKVVSVW